MARDDLIGGSLWESYSSHVRSRMNDPKNQGEISSEEAKALGYELIIADYGAESCGDAVRLYWMIEPKEERIIKSRFKSFGCGTAIASSDMMAELCEGKSIDEALKITNIDVEKALRDDPLTPAVPGQKMHCSVMAYDVIKKAASLYKGVSMESLEEEHIICECARVSYETLVEVIRLNGLTTLDEVIDYTKAGAFCKSCQRAGGHEVKDIYLEEILAEVLASQKPLSASKTQSIEAGAFGSLGLVQQIKYIEGIFDDVIRPTLRADGGDVELMDLKQEGEGYEIMIRYQGACMSCSMNSTTTLAGIEDMLKFKLKTDVKVFIQ